jgi:hypothetical protein
MCLTRALCCSCHFSWSTPLRAALEFSKVYSLACAIAWVLRCDLVRTECRIYFSFITLESIIPIYNALVNGTNDMSDDIFDFGFTAVSESELQDHTEAEKLRSELASEGGRADRLYEAITPLLDNLKKNPENEYILWPNRLEKVLEFEKRLRAIYKDG